MVRVVWSGFFGCGGCGGCVVCFMEFVLLCFGIFGGDVGVDWNWVEVGCFMWFWSWGVGYLGCSVGCLWIGFMLLV